MPTKLTVIDGQRSSKPTRKLGRHGSTLWRNIIDEFEVDDAGGWKCYHLPVSNWIAPRVAAPG